MASSVQFQFMHKFSARRWQRFSLSLLGVAIAFQTSMPPRAAQAQSVGSVEVSQAQLAWDAIPHFVSLVDSDDNVRAFLIQLDVFNKPVTSYANVVYQIFARQGGERQLVYTSQGARLLPNEAGRLVLPVEIVSINTLEKTFENLNLNNVVFEVETQLRYDQRGARRDQFVAWSETYRYEEVTQISTVEFEQTYSVYDIRELILVRQTGSAGTVLVNRNPYPGSCAIGGYSAIYTDTEDNEYDRRPRGSDYSRSDLRYADFSHAHLRKAKFDRSNLSYANFYGADLEEAKFKRAVLHGSNFQNAYLQKAKFDDARLTCARFAGAKLQDAKFKKADLRGADFRGADLRDADFKDADLRGADLRGAVLDDANFKDALLDGALLPHGFSTR